MAFERTEGGRSGRPMHRGRRKVCSFCMDHIEHIDYKDVPRLRKYVSGPRSSPAASPAPALSISAS